MYKKIKTKEDDTIKTMRLEPMIILNETDIIPCESKMPNFPKDQKIINKEGVHDLDEKNKIIIKYNVLDEDDLKQYIKESIKVKRESSFSGYSMKPRFEVCYTLSGEEFKYSGNKHLTTKYPSHVLKVIPIFKDKIREMIESKDLKYEKLSISIDILYSPEIERGGSISPHSDDEMEWGLVIIFSLGQTRWLRIRNKETKKYINVEMKHNSIVCMYGETFQKKYTHQVDKLKKDDNVKTRLSLNIRFLE